MDAKTQARYASPMLAKDMIEKSVIAAVVTDPEQPDNPIIACNDAFLRLTGYGRDEVIGRNCRFLRGPDTEPEKAAVLRDAVYSRQPALVEILNYRKDGTRFLNAVMIAPIFDADGRLDCFLGSQVEVVQEAEQPRSEVARGKIASLSRRQREILTSIAAGKLNKQIAWELSLSERTVKLHRSAVLKALGVRTAADAIRIAIEAGL